MTNRANYPAAAPAIPTGKDRIPLRDAAAELQLTPLGTQKLLNRVGVLHRDDGRWYVDRDLVSRIKAARDLLRPARIYGTHASARRSREP